MTRKVTLSIILIILVFGCFILLFGNQEGIRSKVASVKQLETSSKELNTAVTQLEKNSTTEYEEKKNELKKIIKEYREAKKEYDKIVPQYAAGEMISVEENELKDIYDVDFLWTIVGNYATEEGINLKMDINKNTTSASSINNTSSNYVVCDLKFVITGKYINLTDFIYDIEDDDRLNFEISDFDMQKNEQDLQVTLTVREIKVNASTLINSNAMTSTMENQNEIFGANSTTNTVSNTTNETQTIDSTTTVNNIN